MDVTGSVDLDGTCTVSIIGRYSPSEGDSFTILTFGSRSGTFTSWQGLSLGGGLELDPVYTAGSLVLTVVSTGSVVGYVLNSPVLGFPLTISKDETNPDLLDLSWDVSCGSQAVDYAIFEGFLGDTFYLYEPRYCSTSGMVLYDDFDPSVGDTYYVIVPLSPSEEGSYGLDSTFLERPQSPNSCFLAQDVNPCP